MFQRFAVLLALLILPAALAERPFVVPNYYLSQIPQLEVGVPVSGELTDSDGQNYKDGSHLDLYRFDGVEGNSLTLQLDSDDFDTYLSVFDPSGYLLVSNDDSDLYGDAYYSSSVGLYVDVPGTYMVVVTGYSQYDLGAYELQLMGGGFSAADAETIAVPNMVSDELQPTDPPVPGGWAMSAPSKAYGFSLAQPTVLRLDATSNDFDTYLYLFDAAGFMVAENDDADYSEASDYDTSSTIMMLLQPGDYVVYVSSWSADGVGAFDLAIEEYVPKP